MRYVLVDDPTYKGKPPAPKILRTWAMRLCAQSGMSVSEIAKKYGVPYTAAYRAVHDDPQSSEAAKAAKPPKPKPKPEKPSAKPAMKRPRREPKVDPVLDPKLIQAIKTSELKRIVYKKGTPLDDPRANAAADELDRRDPHWND